MNEISTRESLMKISAAPFTISTHKKNYWKDLLSFSFKRGLKLGIPVFILLTLTISSLVVIFAQTFSFSVLYKAMITSFVVTIVVLAFSTLGAKPLEHKSIFSKTRYGKEIILNVQNFEKWLSDYGIVPATSLVPTAGWDSFARLVDGSGWQPSYEFLDVDGNKFEIERKDSKYLRVYYIGKAEVLKGESFVQVIAKTPVRFGFKIPNLDPYGVRVSSATNLEDLMHKTLRHDGDLVVAVQNVESLLSELQAVQLSEEQESSLSWITDEAEDLSGMVLKALKVKDLASLDKAFELLVTEGFERLSFMLRNIQTEIVEEAQTDVEAWLNRVEI